MKFDSVKQFILDLLEKEIPASYHYHSVSHTLDVLAAAERIARAENMGENQIIYLKTAAVLHDSGMIQTYKGHEVASIEIARRILPGYNYTPVDIEKICSIILATVIEQNPADDCEKIIRDADLDYLGRQDYFIIAQKLRLEWQLLGVKEFTQKDWYRYQLAFLSGHRFYTESAQKSNEEGKQKNIRLIKDLLGE
ncbi:MAG: HD domain-containing protein [Bacteroidota bacterium]